MSLKDLFKEDKNLQSFEPLTKEDFADEIESFDYAAAVRKRDERYVATENFYDPANFARFGLAEKYYEDTIKRIYNTYPYDGSLKEKVLWEVSSSLLDLYIFENGYPRTTGYANFLTSVATSGEDGDCYPPSGDNEYILTIGGPHAGKGNSLYYDSIKKEMVYRQDANVWATDDGRENNLKIGGTDGNTVEFWLKKDAYVAHQEYFEFICDAHVTGTVSGDDDFGRLSIALATTGTVDNSAKQPILVRYASGSTTVTQYLGSSTLTTASIADGNWHHYALRMITTGSNTQFDLFVDGKHNDVALRNGTVGYVSGAIVATVGAQAAPYVVSSVASGSRGWSKFSGSLDEFRYWKTWRTSKQIQRYWFDQVGGGTNTDLANTDLGVYYKFNEGITQVASIDSIALDYSGRVSNGDWVGYDTSSRTIGSAMTEAGAASFEFRDPIIYSENSKVSTYLTNMKGSGSIHDTTNANSLLSYMPNWIIEENETDKELQDKNYLLNLLQIIASYFDEASIMLQRLPELNHKKYYTSGSAPPPFNKFALESTGFIAPDIFINSSLLEKFQDRDNELKFENSLQEIKNIIYQNIYNNLDFIYKSKGTEKAFRNLFHCFGLGDNTLKFNIYANNMNYKLEDNLKFATKTKNYINFNEVENSDASVYQYQIDSDSTSYISASQDYTTGEETKGLAFTLESNLILPNRVTIAEYSTVKKGYEGKIANLYPLITDSSLFGLHTADGETENDLTWNTNDYANFQVLTVKDDKFSSNAYFKLTGSAGGFVPLLTSSLFEDVYNDQLWTVAVTVEPSTYPFANEVGGTDSSDYTVRFYGVNYVADYKAQSFLVTGTMTNAEGKKFLASHKRAFVGSHRTNFTGSVVDLTDVKVNSCKAWMSSPSTDTFDQHNKKIGNYGSDSGVRNAFLYQDSISSINVPEIETLALLWDFSQVTASNAGGQFSVEDETSGSASDNRYGWFSDVVSRRHTASGSFFDTSSTDVVQSLERGTYQTQVPEVLNDSNLVRILSEDDEFFNRNTRPTTYHMSIEKNLFQDISEEMLNMFGSVVYFNKMIGDPVNVYRGEYKELKKAAALFFEKVDNDYDFDKYVEYFKFIDYAVSRYIAKLIPASMNTFKDGISTIIENFALGDRSKYQSKFPIIKDVKPKKIVGQAVGINELLYNWKYGHAPTTDDQDDNCLWWKDRTDRTNTVITSGDADVDSDRQEILDTSNNETNAAAPTLYDSGSSTSYSGSTYVIRKLANPLRIKASEARGYHGGTNFNHNRRVDYWMNGYRTDLSLYPYVSIEDYVATSSCNDVYDPDHKAFRHFSFFEDDINSNITSPFNIVSASADRENVGVFGTNNDKQIVNIHYDAYGDGAETPMQGPFTDAHVGGAQHRHVPINTGGDDITNRPEQFRIDAQRGMDNVFIFGADQEAGGDLNVNLPRADFLRDGTSKSPVNIANIQSTTGSQILGNYYKSYEIVLTNGRSINNRFLAESDGNFLTASADSYYVSGVVDFTLPRRDLTGSNQYVIVNRFSAPGDPATMAEGMLDVAAGEYSVYNALPWRNLSVITPMNELLSDHCKQFGYFSDAFDSASYVLAGKTYPGTSGSVNEDYYYATGTYIDATASFHKVNRNTRKVLQYTDEYTGDSGSVITASRHDNAFVTHLIPQSDMQYAWISGNTENVILGYETRDLGRKDYASSDIQFVTSSALWLGDDGGTDLSFAIDEKEPTSTEPWFNYGFTAIQTGLINYFTSSTNLVGLPAGYSAKSYINQTLWQIGGGEFSDFVFSPASAPAALNALLLHRDGPYGGANWKLYRKDNHPIVRHQRNNNVIGTTTSKTVYGSRRLGFPVLMTATDYEINNFTEPPITSKFKPLIYSLPSSDGETITHFVSSLGNLHGHFTNHQQGPDKANLDILLPTGQSQQTIKKITYSPYSAFKLYVDKYNNRSNVQVVYSETIYPKEQYTYLSGSRKRLDFANDFWRTERDDRTSLDYVNSAAETIDIASIWKLDAHTNFADSYIEIPYSGGMPVEDGAGELQNCYSLFHYAASAGGGARSDIIPATSYNRRTKLIHPSRTIMIVDVPTKFYQASNGIAASTLPEFTDLTNAPTPSRFSASVGDTLWEVTNSAGDTPSYDSYDDYAEEGFRNLKGGTILPEFRISEKIDDYITAGVDLNYDSYNPISFFNAAKQNNNFVKLETGLLTLTGSQIASTDVSNFLERHVFSDFYEYFNFVETDYADEVSPDSQLESTELAQQKLSCEAMLKFLPYDGFYPSERCVQLGAIFSQSLNNTGTEVEAKLEGADKNLRTIMQPYFAPGVLFNSIKSGIATDYPIATDDSSLSSTASLIWGICVSGNYDKRYNIDDLIQPTLGDSIIDSEVDLDLALNSTGTIQYMNPKYTFAMSNFLAETMNSFVGQSNYSSIYSNLFDPEEEITVSKTGIYEMNIVLRNSVNILSENDFTTAKAELTNYLDGNGDPIMKTGGVFPSLTSSLQVNTSPVTMYSRAITGYNIDPFLYGSSYGPPVHSGEIALGQYSVLAGASWYQTASADAPGASFDPYTPSYYNGYSRVTISVPLTASAEGGTYGLNSIIQELTHSYDRMNTFLYPVFPPTSLTYDTVTVAQALDARLQTTAYRNAMQLSASLNLGDKEPNQIIYETYAKSASGNPFGVVTSQFISFRPRFECPVLDFSNASPALSYVSGNVAKGMWHQKGVIPGSNAGIQLEIKEPDDMSLAKVLKIDPKQATNIGKLKSQETFSEAIIAIPFKYNNDKTETILYDVDTDVVDLIKENLYFDDEQAVKENPFSSVKPFDSLFSEGSRQGKSVYDLLMMMRKYVIPPHLDFLHNNNVPPFVMFMMEFEIDLNREDLTNIWQNIAPTFAKKAIRTHTETTAHLMPTRASQTKGDTIPPHPYFSSDYFNSENTRWAVFKVKKRAKTNYNSVVGTAPRATGFLRKDMHGKNINDFLYSYNWPHDFFSLIELAKIDSITTFNPIYNDKEDS